MRFNAFCDASFDRRTKLSGLAYHICGRVPSDVQEKSPVSMAGCLDGNHAEFVAVYWLLSEIVDYVGESAALCDVVIKTDSDHVERIWQGVVQEGDVRKEELALLTACRQFCERFSSVNLEVVKGHVGWRQPEQTSCDKQAKRAMRAARDGVSPAAYTINDASYLPNF